MKRISLILICLFMLAAMVGCGGNDDVPPTSDSSAQQNVSVDLSAVLEQIKVTCSLTETRTVNADTLFDVYGIAAQTYKQAACCMVPTGVFPAEVLMFEAVDAAALADITAKLELRLQEVRNQSQSYDAENYALAQQCAVRTVGNYVILFVSADAAAMNSVFDTFVK